MSSLAVDVLRGRFDREAFLVDGPECLQIAQRKWSCIVTCGQQDCSKSVPAHCRHRFTAEPMIFLQNRDISGEPTSGLEPLTCSLRVSPCLASNLSKNAGFAGASAFPCPPSIRPCRTISSLLLTLLLTIVSMS